MRKIYLNLKRCYSKNKQIINYLICGGLTTLVNFITYIVIAKLFNVDEVLSSALAWFTSVLFAYFANKIVVFESKSKDIGIVIKELGTFFLCRILSGILCDVGTFALMVKVIKINDIISKVVTQVMVVILNYILSKWIVFKKK